MRPRAARKDDTIVTAIEIKRALISVSDKTGLEALARALAAAGVELLSTGGTAKTLRGFGLSVTDVSDVTGFPEIMDGRVKTLHPKIHGGLLAVRGNADHEAAMAHHGIDGIDLLCVNLYPFEQTVACGAGIEETIENIDVGGPAMIRAAAKNHGSVVVLTDPEDYSAVVSEIQESKTVSLSLRQNLAAKAFSRTASYDAAIASWMSQQNGNQFPERMTVAGQRVQVLRYGENPHQQAAAYRTTGASVLSAEQVQGKELSYNNINDGDAALEVVSAFDPTYGPACVIVKHANPCGVAKGVSLADAYAKALACDSTSAFGGIIAVNQTLDGATAEQISQIFTEVILAPDATEDARRILATKKNLRLLVLKDWPSATSSGLVVKSILGGYLAQTRDSAVFDQENLKVVTKRQPRAAERDDLLFAWTVAKFVKSNAIVLAKNGATVGIGAGQMSRIDSTRIAVSKSLDAAKTLSQAKPLAQGSVLSSDAFFPFADGIEAAADAGVTAIIQPGGAMRDDEVIAAADARGLAMMFTGLRHFRH
jgi:phosphoribosylaminoimidazolecarboxamide formyltransferase / IMP cyclohydrolase